MKKYLVAIFGVLFSFSTIAQTILFDEDFEGSTLEVTSSSAKGTSDWGVTSTYKNTGTYADSAVIGLSDTIVLELDSFSSVGYSYLELNFSHVCKIDFFDEAKIQYSVDSGSTWTTLTSSEYSGSGVLSFNAFSSLSYVEWNPFSATALPTSSWWRNESFELNAAAEEKDVRIQFLLIDADNNGAIGNYGWLVDDIEVIGSNCELGKPQITFQTPIPQGTIYKQGPFDVIAEVTDTSGLSEVKLVYSLNGGSNDTVNMFLNNLTTYYEGTIPKVAGNDTIDYYVFAIDASNCSNKGETLSRQIISKINPPPTCSQTVSSFPYSETFSSFSPGNGGGFPTSRNIGTLRNGWENVRNGTSSGNDDHNWWVYDRQAKSRTFGFGPLEDHSPGDTNYMFVEATGHFNETAYLNTPCFDFTAAYAPEFSFWYHMYGGATVMGDLHLDVYYGGKWVLDVMPVISGNQGDNWLQRKVDLSAYAGVTIKLRFRAETGPNWSSDIAIDDIEIIDPTENDIELSAITAPNEYSCLGNTDEYITVEITNLGAHPEDSIPLSYQIDNGTVVVDTVFTTINPGSSAIHTIQHPFDMSVSGTYSIDVWHEFASDQINENDSITNYLASTSEITTQYPDTTDFDNFDPNNASDMLDGWVNGPNDYWFIETGGTPSAGTGPTADHTSGSGNYVYMEANGFPGGQTEASIISKCYDINNMNKPEAELYYNMSGADMGELHFDIYINGVLIKDISSSISGDQGTAWKQKKIDLALLKGNIRLVFRGVVGSDFRSDIAIDDVIIVDNQPVGVDENLEKEIPTVKVFPNPAVDKLFIRTNINELADLIVQDALGRQVYTTNFNGPSTTIDVSTFESGIYYITVITDTSRESTKFFKQ